MVSQTEGDVPDWKVLETLVAMIQRQLSPDARVEHNVKLYGYDSEVNRQIDVLVEQSIGQYKMRIVIDCKDYASPIDVKGVEEFHGLVQDVRAHQGALVCPSGFTKAALKRAKRLNISLYRPVSTGKHKWQVEVTAPVLCDFRSSYMAFGITCSAPKPLRILHDFYKYNVYDHQGNILGTSLALAQSKWDLGQLPSEPGEHDELLIFNGVKTYIDNGYGDTVEVQLTVKLFIEQKLYFGRLKLEDVQGLQDQHTGYVVANAFTIGGLNPQEVEQTWTRIQDLSCLESTPILTVVGYDCYGVGS